MTVLHLLLVCHAFVYIVEGTLKKSDFLTLEEFEEFKAYFQATIQKNDVKLRQQESEIKDLKNTVRELESHMENEENKLSSCSKRVDMLESLLTKDISNDEFGTDNFENSTKDIERGEIAPSKLRIRGLFQTKRASARRNIGDGATRTAFFVRSDDLSDIGKDQVIVFSNVITNMGNLYNAITGVFYCDVTGTYVFSVRIVGEINSGEQVVKLVKNGSAVMYLLIPNIQNDYGSSSSTAVLQLQKGDSVMMKSNAVHNGPSMDSWSYFSGFLLYPA